MGKGGGSVSVPGPTPQETELQQQQADNISQQTTILKQQQHDQALIAPFLYKQAGLNPTFDGQGNLTGFTQDPTQIAQQNLQQQVTTGFLQQTLAAQRGEAPVDPGLNLSLNQSEDTLNNRLSASLGPGYATSTAGAQALNDFATRKASILFGAQRDLLSQDEQMTLANQQGIAAQGQSFAGLVSAPNSFLNSIQSGFGQAANTAGAAVSMFQNDRAMQLQAAMANQQAKSAAAAGQGQLIGAGIGAVATGAAIIF